LSGRRPGSRRILLLSESRPRATSAGTGRRAWQLARGLQAEGHLVTVLSPVGSDGERPATGFDPLAPSAALLAEQPELVIILGWSLASRLRECPYPLVIDLSRPELLTPPGDERSDQQLSERKIAALSRADLVTIAGSALARYLYPWLLLAGFDLRQPVSAIVPALRPLDAGWTIEQADPLASALATTAGPSPPAGAANPPPTDTATTPTDWSSLLAPLATFCRQPFKRQPRPLDLKAAERRQRLAEAPNPTALIDQIERYVDQSRLAESGRQAAARDRLTPARQAVDRSKELLKRTLGVNRRLRLAEHQAVLAGDFVGGTLHGQSFVRGEGRLDQIDLLLATFGRLNDSRLRFHLCRLQHGRFGPDLVALDLSAVNVLDNRFTTIVFPALPPEPGAELVFWLEAPEATPLTSLAVWMRPTLASPARQRYFNRQPVPGQLLFRLPDQAAGGRSER
jgi:hypothetical protein